MMTWALLTVLLFLGLFLAQRYNRLITLRERYRNAFAQIDVQLKRRYDLIPNLVEAARGYMRHERETLERVIQARDRASAAERSAAAAPGDAPALVALMGAEGALTGALGRFFALAEDYPELKADAHMLELQEELSSTENRVAFARQAYNDAVMRYNTTRATVPTNLVAGLFRFEEAGFFQVEAEGEGAVPGVSLR